MPYTTKSDEKDGNRKYYLCIPLICKLFFSEIVLLKTTATTTTFTTVDYSEPKKNKDNVGHIMISYNHSTKAICSKIARELKVREIIIIFFSTNSFVKQKMYLNREQLV